jgi:uncharacterized lipoprotein YddW (UPF0748 family)
MGSTRSARIGAAITLLAGVALVSTGFIAVSPGSIFGPRAAAAAVHGSIEPFRGLGTWVDAYDYAAAYQTFGAPPPVEVSSIQDMARLGVRTVYLQAAKADTRSPGSLVDEKLVGDFLVAAHQHGIRVVAWYLPLLGDLDADLAHVRALNDFRAGGQRFDALALDIEWTQGVPNAGQRNSRLVTFTKRVRRVIGADTALGAIVFPAVQLELINPSLWPDFPYRELAPYVDVWMPMVYWTFRTADYRDPFQYTDDSVQRLRTRLHNSHALVHPVGGIADGTTASDYQRYLQAVRADRAIGWSVYDYNTMASSVWPRMRTGGAPTTTTTAPATARVATTTRR